uniref:Interleukin-1 receptor-associated kinase 3 n=1 Tax=Myripristis murdjan TaxID=586833 RepID=A0A667Y2U6_9TELE
MDSSTFLYDVPPFIIERFCKIMDIGDDRFGWRGLATRIAPSWSEVRVMERLEAVGRSPTSELLWSWAQQNKRVQDLISVLQDMGHCRALKLFLDQGQLTNKLPIQFTSNYSRPSSSDGKVVTLPVFPGNIAGLTTEGCKQHTITFQDIIKGSKNFHHDMKIAGGHFSDVYRAQTGHKTFAVKLFKQVNTASWKKLWDMFRREVEVHQLYKHPNILELLGCFSERGQYCLVYPYLPNGSLYHRLHYQDVDPPLSWSERLVIIKGTAKALHHLHAALPQPVICGNISSANIFLDEGLQPKLSDVGLACLRPQSTNQSCTITLDLNFHSNLGYLPEEYIRDGNMQLYRACFRASQLVA